MQISGDTLLIASAFGFAGLVAGIVITLLFSRGRKTKPEPEAQAPIPKPEPRPVPKPQPVLQSQPVPQKRHPEEAHLWRDPQKGKVLAEIDGTEFAGPENLSPEQRRKLVQVLREVAGWFNETGSKPVKSPLAAETAAPVSQPPVRIAPARPDPAATIYIEPTPAPPPPVVNEKLMDVKKTAPFSIVTQIDAILQGMLHNSPMKTKGIRLVEDPNGGVTVWVGIQRYPGIDAVTDPEALAIIRAAVAEWERQSTD
jgi:hypothetical protein